MVAVSCCGYWLCGRPSARFRADPANFRQNNFPTDFGGRLPDVRLTFAECQGNVRRTPRGNGRIRAESAANWRKSVCQQKLIFHHCSSWKNFRTGRPSAAEILIGLGLGLGLGFRLGLWLWLGLGLRLGLGLEYHNPNPNPNPDPTIISAAEGRPQRKFFCRELWC